MSTSFNIGGVYKSLAACQVNIGGVWKTVTGVYGNIGGVWKELYTSVVANVYELLADTTISTAVTSVDISSLTLGKSDEIILVSDIVNTSASTSTYSLYFNNNTTATNYYAQRLTADNTTVNSARTNNALMVDQVASGKTLIESAIKLANSGYIVAQHNSAEAYSGSGIILNDYYETTTFTATSITQLTITASVTNAIGIGSRFQLYRIGGA